MLFRSQPFGIGGGNLLEGDRIGEEVAFAKDVLRDSNLFLNCASCDEPNTLSASMLAIGEVAMLASETELALL